ncbi:glucan biosynthesis protein [Methylosinus trichosporium]|uniref:Glucan biosynthesis protein D n=1 Tax=Methylosinus trichosporium (strain ATCC 35070 / NCIMB 11131 / UNIQEM 75 / OB3b) TaxID=595536 RepID=A0A2D2CZ58_METT3|nr:MULTISPECIES: glucan biosynthesis protein [Methylosinus]ATQ68031.1 glucan biosynthesis protein D [Methylosinus trichosporium OB3b]OBS53694.1 glucan biosynthesis protein D [Methylosinus sp. 3S-1]
MLERRDVLKAALTTLAASVGPGRGQAQPAPAAPPPGGPAPFNRDTVLDIARAVAKRPFAPPPSDLREPFANLSYEQYVGVKTRPGAAIWSGENRGFSIEPLHRGFIFTAPVELYVVEDNLARRIAYDQTKFDYGGVKVGDKVPDIGFSGFRVIGRREDGGDTELALFQGASFYRAVARGQTLGVTARGLSIRTADPRGEEFPAFRIFWIEKPTLADNALVIHALLESQSVVGAYRFTLRPGEATLIDAELTLIPRAAIDHLGLAGAAASSLFTPLDNRRTDDVRPAVAETNGLQMLTGKDEWLWRPVSNRDTLQISAFVDANPKGLGFLMRERDIAAYQDDVQHWERRPSLWMEPIGDWGEGSVQLVEIPSESEVNANIVAYWRPKQPLVTGKEATYAYRQFWCWAPPARPPLAIAATARGGRSPYPKMRRFIVVFMGEALADPQRVANLRADLTTSPGAATNIRTFVNPQAKTCRVVFDVDPAGETFCEMRLVLRSGDETLSETWLYRWTL